MDAMDAKNQAHKDLMLLWERWKALQKELLTLQAAVGELTNDVRACGKRIYELYQQSDAGLDGREKENTGDRIQDTGGPPCGGG